MVCISKVCARAFGGLAFLSFIILHPGTASATKSGDETGVTACAALGAGFLLIPGTETCLKIGGQITTLYEQTWARDDLYAETLYLADNPLVLYDTVPSDRMGGQSTIETLLSVTAASMTDRGLLAAFASLKGVNAAEGQSIGLDQAFVVMGGLTAGLRGSFFDFSPGFSFTEGYASNKTTALIAYSQQLGARGKVTLSLEDSKHRRADDGVWALRGSHGLPDLVVAARADDPQRGAAQISAAVQKISDDRVTACCGSPPDRAGWAISAGLEYRTRIGPYLGRFLLGGAYADGAASYLGDLPFTTDYLVDVDGRIVSTRGFSLIGSYEHVWREDLKSTLTVSGISTRIRARDLDWRAAGLHLAVGTEYMPAPGLQIGIEGNHYVDIAQAHYFGMAAAKSRADFSKVKAYARRRF